MEYKVVSGKEIHILEKEVSKLLRSGWRLQGGVSVGFSRPFHVYVQALVKDR